MTTLFYSQISSIFSAANPKSDATQVIKCYDDHLKKKKKKNCCVGPERVHPAVSRKKKLREFFFFFFFYEVFLVIGIQSYNIISGDLIIILRGFVLLPLFLGDSN
jgi:hypothetical protein